MKKILAALFFAGVLQISTSFGQSPAPSATPPPENKEDTVIISTRLIQIDATVTDKKGQIVRDLSADDFEIFENDEKQIITNFSFISAEPSAPAKSSPAPAAASNNRQGPAPPPVPRRLRPDQVKRTIALVVDDLGLSFANVKFVRSALKKFVDQQMQDGDLVAIVSTGKGMGALQQFTSDKRMLYAAIEKIKFNLNGREIWSFAPIQPTFKEDLNAMMNAATGETSANVGEGGTAGNVLGTDQDRQFDIGLNQFREDAFAVGTLGAINFLINGMKQLPGRKAVMLFSEGFNLMTRDSMNPSESRMVINPRIEGKMRDLIDAANRSGVVIYAHDPRGLVNTGFTAEDSVVGLRDNPFAADDSIRARDEKLSNTQYSLQYISEETGGFAIINNNNISKGIEKMVNDQNGYYLIGYQPDDETFDPNKRRFNKLKVKLKRSDLRIRYRSGFFSMTDSEQFALTKHPQQEMLDKLTSPFAAGDIGLDLTTLFANDAKNGSYMRSLLHIKNGDLSFLPDKDGWYRAAFEVLAVTFGDNGAIIDTTNRTESIRAKAEAVQEIKEKGLVYSLAVPVKKPGAYQMRVAVRDLNTSKIGSANQFIEVPDLKKKPMVLSGLLLESSVTQEKQKRGEKNIIQSDNLRDRAMRVFSPGTSVIFGATVYNAKSARSTAQPSLSMQFRIFRDNTEIFVSEESVLNLGGLTDTQGVDIGGSFGLGENMEPGEYVLQVIVKDTSKGKPLFVTQWIDFDIAK